jgi:hypothetical protein
VSSLYGFHGVLVLLVSRDPARYLGIVRYLGVMYVLAGVMAIVIDLHAPLPLWWTIVEGPSTALSGALILYLSHFLRS